MMKKCCIGSGCIGELGEGKKKNDNVSDPETSCFYPSAFT